MATLVLRYYFLLTYCFVFSQQDYFVLLPAPYYEGNILVDRVVTPCTVDDKTLCKHFKYPSVSEYDHATTKLGFVFEHGSRQPLLEFITEDVRVYLLNII